MSYGKMKELIQLISTEPVKDAEGFVTKGEHIIASIKAYLETRNASEKWANRASFSTATVLLRFRKPPQITVTTQLLISHAEERYNILSVEDVRGKGMYLEVLAERVVPSG